MGAASVLVSGMVYRMACDQMASKVASTRREPLVPRPLKEDCDGDIGV
jgi:hypothetical protein